MKLNLFPTMKSGEVAGMRSSAASGMEPGTADAQRSRARRELATTVLVALALALAAWLVGPVEANEAVVEDLQGRSTIRPAEATGDRAAGESMGLLPRWPHARSIGTSASNVTPGRVVHGADPLTRSHGLAHEGSETSHRSKCEQWWVCCIRPSLCK